MVTAVTAAGETLDHDLPTVLGVAGDATF